MDSKRKYVCSPKDARPISYSSPISTNGGSSTSTLTEEFETIEIEDDETENGKVCFFENINSVPIAIDSPPISIIMKDRPEAVIRTDIRTLKTSEQPMLYEKKRINKEKQLMNLQSMDKTKTKNSAIVSSTSQILLPSDLHQQSLVVKSNKMIVISTMKNPEGPQNNIKTNEDELVEKIINGTYRVINSSGIEYDPLGSQKNYHKTIDEELTAVKSTSRERRRNSVIFPKHIHVESQKSHATEKIVKEGKRSHVDKKNSTAVFPKQSLVESQRSYVAERRDKDEINLMKKKDSGEILVGSLQVTPKQVLVQEKLFLPDPGDIADCESHDNSSSIQQNEMDPLYIPEQGEIMFATGSSDSHMKLDKYSHFPCKTSKKNVKGAKNACVSSGVKNNTVTTNSLDKKPPSKVTSERKYAVTKNSFNVPPIKSPKLPTSSRVKDPGVGKVEAFVESNNGEHSIVISYSIQNQFNEVKKKKPEKPKKHNTNIINRNTIQYRKSTDCCRNFFIKNSAWDHLEYDFRGFNEREQNISATCFDYFVQLWSTVGANRSLVDHDYVNQLYYTRRIEVLDSRGYLDKVILPHEGKRKREVPYVLPPTKKCKIVLERNEIVEDKVKDFQLNEKLSTFVLDELVLSVEDENKPLIILNKININVLNVTEKLAKHSNVLYVTDRERFPEKLLKNPVLVELIQEKVVKMVTPKALKKMFL